MKKKQMVGMAAAAFTVATLALSSTSLAQDAGVTTPEATTDVTSTPRPKPRPENLGAQQQTKTPETTTPETRPERRQEYSMSDSVLEVLESFDVNPNDLEFIPMSNIRFEPTCLDRNNNGIADREVASTTTKLIPPKWGEEEMTTEINRTYGEIAKVDENLSGVIIYADLNDINATTDFSGANVETIIEEAQEKPFDSIAIIYDAAQVVDGKHPLAYLVPTINGKSSIAFIDGYNPYATPAQKACSSLKKPAPGQPG